MSRKKFPDFSNHTGGGFWKRFFGSRHPRPQIGRRTFVDPSAQFLGCEQITIGNRCVVSEQCWLNVNDRSRSEPAIVIEDHSILSRRTFMSSGRLIHIGPYCLIGNDCCFLGADHDFSDPFIPYLTTPAVNDSAITLGANCWLGIGCTVLKGVSIGFGSVVGAKSIVTKSIPPMSVVVGSPARVLRRYRTSEKRWVDVAEWCAKDESELISEQKYLETLRETHPWVSMPYAIGGTWFGNK